MFAHEYKYKLDGSTKTTRDVSFAETIAAKQRKLIIMKRDNTIQILGNLNKLIVTPPKHRLNSDYNEMVRSFGWKGY